MEYFALQYDRQVLDLLQIDTHELDLTTRDPFIMLCEMEENTSAPEFFIMQEYFAYYFFVSDRLKELLDVYSEDYEAVPCFLTDMKRQRQECFWKITLPEIYQTEQEEQEKNNDLYIEEKKVQGRYIFTLVIENKKYIIVSLHLAEHMLRKNCYGIQYSPVRVS
jgi:hypothetical protein